MKPLQFLSFTLFMLLCVAHLYADKIILRSGRVIEGQIGRQTKYSVSVYVKNKKREIRKSQIRNIEYESKVYRVIVRMTNGTEFFANIVKEEPDKYTFRKQKNSTKTFSIIKRNISFIVPANPVNVRARTTPSEISLEWYHPYKQVKYYNIYLRKGSGEYRLSGQTSDNEFTFKGLLSNSIYSVKITSVDEENEESQSAVLEALRTKNRAPERPYGLKFDRTMSADKQKMNLKLSWEEPVDSDGRVVGYNIYELKNDEYVLLGQTQSREYFITNLDTGITYNFSVRAVDDGNTESEDGTIENSYLHKSYFLSLQFNYVMPLGSYSEVTQSGSGVMFNYTVHNVLTEDFVFQTSVGIYSFSALKDDVGSLYSIPASLGLGYQFSFSNKVLFTPYLGGGIILHSVSEKDDVSGNYENSTYLAPQLRANAEFNYKYADNVSILFNAGYTVFFETNNKGHYASFGIGAQFLL